MLRVLFYALIAGVGGTAAGGLICALTRLRSGRGVVFLMSFSGGVMAAVACFGLFPEAEGLAGIPLTVFSGALGILAILTVSEWLDSRRFDAFVRRDRMFRAGVLLVVGIALHNFPAGLAIGAGDLAGRGVMTACCVGLRNVPEGLAMGMPLKLSGVRPARIVGWSVLSGIFTVLGSLCGYLLGLHAPYLLATGLAFSGGAILYLSLGVLFSESVRLYRGNTSAVAWTGGLLLGFALMGIPVL